MTLVACQISTSDADGGAAIAAYRLHDGLRRVGVRSRMAVGSCRSGDPDVIVYDCRQRSFSGRLHRKLGEVRLAREQRAYSGTRSPTLELFSDDRVAGPDPFSNGLPAAHVYNLHWIATLVDYRRFFARLGPETPLVWTLHDMNPLTGGCHYALGCEGFTVQCGACVQLGSRVESDLSRRIFRRKARALERRLLTATRIVAPSTWMAGEARRSALLGRFDIEIIPNGIDCNIFQPRSRALGREAFGLPRTNRWCCSPQPQ